MSITENYINQWLPMVKGTHMRKATVELVNHTRALEAVLIEIVEKDTLFGTVVGLNHESATKLAKLLEGVE